MRKYHNILVVMEAKDQKQIALNRALEILKFSPETKVTLFLPLFDISYDLTLVLSVASQLEMKDNILKVHQLWLEDIINNHYDQNINYKIAWNRNITEAVIKESQEENYDLIIKSSYKHGLFDNLFFTPMDWELLRYSKIPVIIAKEHEWKAKQNLIVAINFANPNKKLQRLMNLKLLRNAQELAHLIDANIHLVNISPVIVSTPMVDIPGFSVNNYSDSLRDYNYDMLCEFGKRHRIPEENCHVTVGNADLVLPEIAQELDACAIILGNDARNGLTGTILGNMCEAIGDEINCDLLVIRNEQIE
ncbi:MAG: universal stress protein UspE [Succinivibrionaceae bacterium]|nr:universal stress protein UspE [Ruminobacter sp.]MDY5780255.1 universal stress protein UspE [Succinivibrionaceae bacterium]MEE1340688.1 universal stress protein UspE [Succinivibrionaceae bacterium]